MSLSDMTRRQTLALLGTTPLMASTGNGLAQTTSDAEPLKDIAAKAGLTFGCAVSHDLASDADFRALVLRETQMLAAENAMKFGSLRPDATSFSFDTADALVKFCEQNGKSVRGHTLIWNDWPPTWLKQSAARDFPGIMDRHIETVMGRYAGRITSWDVVNEPFHWKDGGALRPGPWALAMGEDYIFRAFATAAVADPKAKLVLNEAWTERSDALGLGTRRALLLLIDRMRDKGLRIDAIGLQAHLMPDQPYDDAGFVAFLHEIEQRGLEIYLTEFDIDERSFQGNFAERDRQVADRAYKFLTAALSVKAVKLLMTWGLSDRYTWWREPSLMQKFGLKRLARPLPFDDTLRAKPLRDAMARTMRERKA